MNNILVLDDDKDVLKALKRLLKKEYNVYTAKSPSEATSILDQTLEDFPVVVIDYNLQDKMTGIDYAKVLNKKYPLSQMILFTSEKSIDTVIDALNCGAIQSFLNKPVKPIELKSRIKETLHIWKDKKRVIDEMLELDYDGSGLNYDQLHQIGISEESYRTIRDRINSSKQDIIYGLVISNMTEIVFSHFINDLEALKNSDLFGKLIESVCRLNLDIFVETQSHQLEELNLMNTSIIIRPIKGMNFMLFVDGHPKNKQEFQAKMDLLINEIACLLPSTSTNISEKIKNDIIQRIVNIRSNKL